VVQNLVFGALIGAIFSNIVALKLALQQAFALATIFAMVAFVTLSLGTQVSFNDRLVLEREMSDGMFSPFAHFAQRLVIGIPLAVFVALCLILPSYFWIGLNPSVDAILFFILVNTAVVFCFDSVVFFLTLIVSDVRCCVLMCKQKSLADSLVKRNWIPNNLDPILLVSKKDMSKEDYLAN
jgi:hypothetical protein